MLNRRLHCLGLSLGVALCAPALLLAQTTPPASAPAVQAPAAITAAEEKVPKATSKAEEKALQQLQSMSTSASTTPDQMDAALLSFVTKFPNSDYLSTVNTYGLRFYQLPAHKDYEKSLLYGEQAIQHNPAGVFALATVGDLLARHVQDTDLDFAARVSEATRDDQQAIQVADSAGAKINGVTFPDSAKNLTRAIAYNSLAVLATKQKNYAAAVTNYQQAAKFDGPPNDATDYFYMARAQMQLKQYPQALASLDQASRAAPDNPQVQAAVASNRRLIAQLEKNGGQ